MTVTYKLKELNKEDPMDSVIEKTGHTVEFSMSNVRENEAAVEKAVKELTAQKNLEDAKMRNIEEHYPFVQGLTDFELSTASLYWESRQLAKACATKLVELEQQRSQDMVEIEEIYRQVPEVLGAVPSNGLDADIASDVVPAETEPVAETPAEVAPVEEVQPAAEPVAETPAEVEPTPETNA